jgi:aminoglycoside phosphotransferase (APT) family kinase protein
MIDISGHKNFTRIEPINKGWSGDQKYCVTKAGGIKYLLRISPIEQYERKKSEFEMMQRVAFLGVPMCLPIEFGTCDEGVYSLQSWIDGEDAEDKIPFLSGIEQYQHGIEAGKILKTIHSIPAPDTQENWESRFNRKIDHKIKSYTDCPIKYDGGDAFIEYINDNRFLLKNRPQCYQHGDYHIGNMMIDDEGNLIIIDFNRNDFGDPWEEFNRIVWCAQKSPLFATGMVNGYFDGDVPLEFWRLLALYISSNTLSSVPWAIPFGQSEIVTMLNQAKEVLQWYDNMKNPVPTWYTDFKPGKCFCGHDCSRCITYLATIRNDINLRTQSQQFYKDEFELDIPLGEINCLGGRSDNILKLCRDCPWMKCCRERKIDACSECTEYPCKPLAKYQAKYVNKGNQLEG